MSRTIATVYLRGTGVNKVVPTGPGRKVEFRGGAGIVAEARDMPAMLGLPGVQVAIEQAWIDWAPEWAKQCAIGAPAVAEVTVAGVNDRGILVGPPPGYEITKPLPAAPGVVDPTTELSFDPRWKTRRRGAPAQV